MAEVNKEDLFRACESGDVDYLRRFKGQNLEVREEGFSSYKRTTLHLAAENGHLPVVEFLVKEANCNAESTDTVGETPLHYAIKNGHLPVVEFLVKEANCNVEATDGYGSTPLHDASRYGHLPVVEFLMKEANCNPECANNSRSTPLQFASWKGHLPVVEFLVREANCNAEATSIYGETPLHYASKYGHLPVVEYLVKKAKCNVESTESHGWTPLHLASFNGRLPVIEFLVKEGKANVECVDNDGETPLHRATRKGHLPVIKVLVKEGKANVECTTNDGETPLHFARSEGRLPIIEFLVKEANVNVDCADKDGETLLHYVIRRRHLQLVELLLKGRKANVKCANKNGWTPLHVACGSYNPSKDIIESLLECHADPNAATNHRTTPIQMVRSSDLIQLLLKYGAKPNYDNWEEHLSSNEHAAQITTKAYIVGDPGAGKSSLTKCIKTENKGLTSLKNRVVKMTGVNEKTAGIVPHELCNEKFGRVTLLDFAGHKEYYAAHDTVIRSSLAGSQSAVFFLLVNLTYDDEKFKSNLLYWLGFIENQYQSDDLRPHIIIVGSHVDQVNGADLRRKRALAKSLEDGGSFEKFQKASELFVTLDCRYSESSSLSKLRSMFADVCTSIQKSQQVSFASHWYLVYLLDKFRDHKAIKLSDLLAKSFDFSQDVQSMIESCEQLSAHGNLLFLKNQQSLEKSWIVLDKPALLTRVHGSIFAPEGFRQHHQFATITGVVLFSKLVSYFADLDSDLLAHFLCHLEFCYEVTDLEILSLLQATSDSSSSDERYFFFPGLVCLEMPETIWKPSDAFSYHTGWLLQCLKPEHFFTPRFVQVLLLRLAFAFGLEPTAPSMSDLPVLERTCSVWKNGISWSDRSGVRALVEVADQKQVVVLLRCRPQQEMALVRTRSSIIQTVLSIKKEFCPKIIVKECLLQPQDASQYPLDQTKLKPVTMTELSKVIREGNRFAVLNTGEQVEVEVLLFFEPYTDLGEAILCELFDNTRANYHELIRDEFFNRVSDKVLRKIHFFKQEDKVLKKMTCYIELFGTSLSHLDDAPSGETHKLVRVFQVWRESQEEGSRSDLRKTLDQFSVFAGRNPMAIESDTTNRSGVSPKSSSPSATQSESHKTAMSPSSPPKMRQTHEQLDTIHTDHTDADVEAQVTCNPSDDVPPQSSSFRDAQFIEKLRSLPPPDLCTLTNIKWTNEKGERKRCSVIDEISPKWHKLGRLLGVRSAKLETISMKNQLNPEPCCIDVLTLWLEHGSSQYPLTWEGVLELLEDLDENELVSELENALHSL